MPGLHCERRERRQVPRLAAPGWVQAPTMMGPAQNAMSGGRTVGAHLVEPGAVLADRYVVEDLLAQEGPSESWRARDRMLARSVVLVVLPSDSPFAADLVAAAKRASRVTDTRILQVLDAIDDGELTYVVREWATGQSLDIVLSEGPLQPAERPG